MMTCHALKASRSTLRTLAASAMAAGAPPAVASAGSGDVMDVGAHCSAPGCAQLDFLPFRCAGCSETHCAEHRGKLQHGCPAAGTFRGCMRAAKGRFSLAFA